MKIQSDKNLLFGLLLMIPVLFLFSATGYVSTELASAMVSSLLTAFLVFLYLRQTEIQSHQTNIMESQEQLMEANHNPLIDIDSFVPSTRSIRGRDKNSVKVTLENVGNGVAVNPSLYVDIDFEDENYNPESGDFPLIRQQNVNKEDWDNYSNLATALPPDTTPKAYQTTMQVPYSKGKEGEIEWEIFPAALKTLYDEAIYDISLKISVSVQDVTGEYHDFEILKFDTHLPNVVKEFESHKDDTVPSIENAEKELSFYRVFKYELAARGVGIIEDTADPTPWTNKMDELAVNALKKGLLQDMEES